MIEKAEHKHVERRLVVMVSDVTRFTQVAERSDNMAVAAVLDDDYTQRGEAIRNHGGRVVKFIGDGCLAVFPEERCVDAVDCGVVLRRILVEVYREHGHRVDVGINLHLANVAEGKLGSGEDARYDVVGAGVNHAFIMGRGAGIRLSEPVYRKLPNERRGDWHKRKPPAVYSLS